MKNIKEEVDVLEKSSVTKGNTKDKKEKSSKGTSKGKFKSELIKGLVEKLNSSKNKEKGKDEIKEKNTISLGDILKGIDEMSETDIKNICDDIESMNLKVGIDSKTIQFLVQNKNNENIKKMLSKLNMSMDVDISSIAQFRKSDVDTVRKICEESGCNIDKVYVNTGWDEGALQGYSFEKYDKIIQNAEKLLEKALRKVPKNASKQDKVMAIYNAVLKASKYDYSALKKNSSKRCSSRNLEGFFLQNGSCVCAGNATALQNLLECEGINVEYVQGYAKHRHTDNPDYHSWIKVQLDDGNWYNCDPTWDSNKVGRKYKYCLKSDEEFFGHTEDESYNPTYERGSNAQRYRSTTRKYKLARRSKESEYLSERYQDTELDESLRIAQQYSDMQSVNEEYLTYARKNKIPINAGVAVAPRLTFKQKIAEFFNRSKHLKNISFVKKFIEKNTVNANNKKTTNVQKQNTAAQLYKVTPQRYYVRNVQQRKNETQNRDER